MSSKSPKSSLPHNISDGGQLNFMRLYQVLITIIMRDTYIIYIVGFKKVK